jgi:nuclear protein localization family protein 4
VDGPKAARAQENSNGDLLFISYKVKQADGDSHPTSTASTSRPSTSQPDPSHPHTHTDPPLPNTIALRDLSQVRESDVDVYWKTREGKIPGKRDPVLCRHGEKAMCEYCAPKEVGRLVSRLSVC